MDDSDQIKLEDWKMTKDRIKHFDDVVMRTRLQGLPIASAIQASAFITADTIGKIELNIFGATFPVFSVLVLAGLFYLVPVILLDVLHFSLLRKAVGHAISIEDHGIFKENLGITKALTSTRLTLLHSVGAYSIYALMILVGIFLIWKAPDILINL